MTMDQIQKRIDEIKHHNGDDEAQHGLEDDLRADFLKYVADWGYCDHHISAKARLVLTTSKMSFARHCA